MPACGAGILLPCGERKIAVISSELSIAHRPHYSRTRCSRSAVLICCRVLVYGLVSCTSIATLRAATPRDAQGSRDPPIGYRPCGRSTRSPAQRAPHMSSAPCSAQEAAQAWCRTITRDMHCGTARTGCAVDAHRVRCICSIPANMTRYNAMQDLTQNGCLVRSALQTLSPPRGVHWAPRQERAHQVNQVYGAQVTVLRLQRRQGLEPLRVPESI